MINWEVVVWTCITVAVLIGIVGSIITFISVKNIRKRTSELKELHVELKVGTKVIFCGGVYGKVVKVGDETVEVEIAKNVIVTVSRYAIQSIT